MDLVTFTEGIQSIHVQESGASPVDTTPSKPFVPLGESVVQHTEALFTPHSTNRDILRSLLIPASHEGVDPNEYDALSSTTLAALLNMKPHSTDQKDSAFLRTLKRALDVLDSLEQDRQLLKSNLTALEKV
ncbi:hypothetical protein BTA51_04765 [Hahella sp. CCB-MM4]|uniref:type III secretion apparatus assembly protein SctX n=1 Tax=Hahella sp. (strain CCB-MM4) TaxID=1926491 RepID=UPI000B9AC270|nr:hypothetical protein [Hahella sp. CCB-MM4]OZG74327.1 hypothetical protein BTA51_04765 [Hahella sp. CCB-MM4]